MRRATGVDGGRTEEGDEKRNHKLSPITASGSAIHNEWLCSERVRCLADLAVSV